MPAVLLPLGLASLLLATVHPQWAIPIVSYASVLRRA
jgi:hypothetical protein